MRLSAALDFIVQRLPASVRAVIQIGNPILAAGSHRKNSAPTPTLVEGDVIRAGPGWYDMTVRVAGMGDIACVALMSIGHPLFGVSESKISLEGSRVMICLAHPGSKYGTVLGVIPNHSVTARVSEDKSKPKKSFASMFELESNGTAVSEAAYAAPLRDKQMKAKIDGGAGRPIDFLPGCYGLLNEQGVGFAVTGLAATLKASSKAQVRVSAIDDQVRILSGYFQHFHSLGTHQSFNDGGHNSDESGVTPYQCERSGFNELGTPAFTEDAKQTLNGKSVQTSLKCVKPKTVARRRLQSFVGFFGDIVNMFVGKPDPTVSPETAEDEVKDQGLAQMHVDSSGRTIIRSANGILLQRWDRIPIPKRLKQPWDPSGDKVENTTGKLPEKKPFKWDEKKPYSRSLHWRDGLAWVIRNAYWHLHNQSKSAGKKDFYLPEENELQTPDNDYDKPGNATEEYQKFALRQAGIGLEDDGSIIIRDAWGSEILMRGGNIIISCAGQIEQKSGKSTVILAGHDIVAKARQSVDISATEKDVRIKAEANLHMLSEGVNGKGGVLIQSLSKSLTGTSGFGPKGEEAHSTGIILSAPDSGVFATAPIVHAAASHHMRIETLPADGNAPNTGVIELSCGVLQTSAVRSTLITTGTTSGLFLGPGSAILGSESVVVAGDNGAQMFDGTKVAVPLTWYDTSINPYSMLSPAIEGVEFRLQGTQWTAPFKPEDRGLIQFTFRTSAQCGTTTPSEIQGAHTFTVFQPFWAVLAKAGSAMAPTKPEVWRERELNGTKPWPGLEAGTKAYAVLDQELNVTPATGVAKARKELVEEGGTISDKPFDEYEVIPHN